MLKRTAENALEIVAILRRNLSIRQRRKGRNFMATPTHPKLELGHLEAIKALAKEIDHPVEEVSQIYASTLESLKSSARIHDYLSVLAGKKVRDKLQH
jgi:hypothetical protein